MSKLPRPDRSITSFERGLITLAMVNGGLFATSLLTLRVVEPEFDPTWRFVSEYTLGRAGWLMTVAFITLSASLIGTAVSVLRHTRTVAGRLGLVLIGVGALGLLIAAAFTTDPITTPADAHSRSGQLHILGASLDFSPIGMLLVRWSLSRTRRWRSVRPKLMITAGVAAALMVAFAAALPRRPVRPGSVGRVHRSAAPPDLPRLGGHCRLGRTPTDTVCNWRGGTRYQPTRVGDRTQPPRQLDSQAEPHIRDPASKITVASAWMGPVPGWGRRACRPVSRASEWIAFAGRWTAELLAARAYAHGFCSLVRASTVFTVQRRQRHSSGASAAELAVSAYYLICRSAYGLTCRPVSTIWLISRGFVGRVSGRYYWLEGRVELPRFVIVVLGDCPDRRPIVTQLVTTSSTRCVSSSDLAPVSAGQSWPPKGAARAEAASASLARGSQCSVRGGRG